jgi:nicotinamidase-related amidase
MTVAATTPYPWPYDGVVDRARTALVVAGWSAHWWNRVHEPEAVVEPIRRLAAAVDAVVFVVHAGPARSVGDGARDESPMPSIAEGLLVAAAGIDGFFGGPLDPVLRSHGIDHLLLVGLGLETTVHSTMRSANDRGFECLLVADACAPIDPAAVAASISMVEMSGGIFGAVGHTADVLAALDPRQLPTEPIRPIDMNPST